MSRHLYGPNGGALPARPDEQIADQRDGILLYTYIGDDYGYHVLHYDKGMMKKSARKKRRQRDRQMARGQWWLAMLLLTAGCAAASPDEESFHQVVDTVGMDHGVGERLAREACIRLDAGASLDSIEQDAVAYAESIGIAPPQKIGAVIGAGIVTFCPHQQELVP